MVQKKRKDKNHLCRKFQRLFRGPRLALGFFALTTLCSQVGALASVADLRWSLKAGSESDCRSFSEADVNRPLVVGLQKTLLNPSWLLQIQLRSETKELVVERVLVDVVEREVSARSSFRSGEGARVISGRPGPVWSFTIPFKGTFPELGHYREFAVVVRVIPRTGKILEFANNVYVLSHKDSLRVYDFHRSCLRSLPPMVTGEPVKSPAGGIYPQDILHEEFVDDEDSHIVNDMSRYLSVGYYVPNGRSVSITNGTPTFAYHFVPALQKTETRRRSLRTQHTFRIRQGEVGYLVAMPAQKMNPYQELRFDSCGRLDPLRSSWTWEEQIIPAFSLLILPEAEEGQFDLIEKKLNEYPKYNTCQ